MGDFLMLNLTNSLTLNLLLSLCLWESLFSYRFTQNLAFLFLLASLAAILIFLLKDALYFDEMSGRISIYLLGFFFVNYRNMIPVMVGCNVSTIWDFRVHYVLKIALCCYFLGTISLRRWKNSVLLSVCMNSGSLIVSLKICSNTFLIANPCLGLSDSNHAYLDEISITTITNLNASLCFESLLISTKSICHCLSIWFTASGLILKLRRPSLCKVTTLLHSSTLFNHSSTPSIDIFESRFFTSWSRLHFPA